MDQLIYDEFNFKEIKFNEVNLQRFHALVQSLNIQLFKICQGIGIFLQKDFENQFQSYNQFKQKQVILVRFNYFIPLEIRKELIYIDETGLGRDYIQPKVWQLKNLSYYIDRVDIKTRINIIGGMSRDMLFYQCLRCNVNADMIKTFLVELISVCNQKYGRRNYVFVFDNASVHKESTVTSTVLKYVSHIYLPPYTPQLNPIEQVWSQFKRNLAKEDCRTSLSFNQAIQNSFAQISQKHLKHYYERAYKIILKCLLKQQL